MAISYVGGDIGTTSATPPTHQAGDRFLDWAYNDGSSTPPPLASGNNWTGLSTAGANSNSARLATKIAAGASEGVGTFTSAEANTLAIYRSSTGKDIATGAIVHGGASSTTINYPALTLHNPFNNSWVVAFAGHRSVNTSLENAPTGMINRLSGVDATAEVAAHDTNGVVGAWSNQNVSAGGTASGYRTTLVELYEIDTTVASTLNPSDKSATVNLSGGNLVATSVTSAVDKGVRGTTPRCAGRWGFAVTVNTMASGNDMGVGAATKDFSLSSDPEAFATAFHYKPTGAIVCNGVTLATVATYGAGDKVTMLFNRDTGGLFVKVNNGNYNNSGSANPDTGAGAITLPADFQYAAIFPLITFWNSNGVVTYDPMATGHGTSTYTAWDGNVGGGPTTYDESFGVAASMGLTQAPVLTVPAAASFAASLAAGTSGGTSIPVAISLAAQTAVAAAAQGDLVGAVSLGATLGLTPANTAVMGADLALPVAAALVAEGGNLFAEGVGLSAALGLSAQAQQDVVGAVTLAVSAAVTSGSTLNAQAALSMALSAGFTPTGAITANAAAAFAVALADAYEGVIAGRTFDEAIGLGVQALIATAAKHDVAASLGLGATLDMSAGNQAQHNLALALSASLQQSVAAALTLAQSLQISATTGMTADGRLMVAGEIGLQAGVAITSSAALALAHGLSFEATFSAAATSRLNADEAMALAVNAAIQLGTRANNKVVSTVTLDGRRQITINLSGLSSKRTTLRGTMTLTVRLNGTLN